MTRVHDSTSKVFKTLIKQGRPQFLEDHESLTKTGKLEVLQSRVQFINWIGELLLFALYPGSSTFRMTNALQFLQAHYKIFSSAKAKEFAEAAGIPLNVLENHVTDVLLSILWTDFEKDRLLALGTFSFNLSPSDN